MATTLKTSLQLATTWNYSDTDGSGREFTDRNSLVLPATVAEMLNGAGDLQANVCFHERRTLTNAAYSYDLAGGITDFRGATKTMVRVKLIQIIVLSTTAGVLLAVGGGANPLITWLVATGDGIKLGPKGAFLLYRPDATGYVVTPGTGDTFTVTAANTVEYDIVIIGADA